MATFRDSTGEPGSVAASTRGRVIRLQPAGRARLTLRHEMLHLVIEQHARAGLSLWYREGLALALAGGPLPTDALYREYRRRTEEAIRVNGKASVLHWAETGVPAGRL